MELENKNILNLKVTEVVEETTISDLLRKNELFSKDVKQKINNKQLSLNGEPMTFEHLKMSIDSFDEAGDFVFKNIEKVRPVSFLNLEELFEVEIPFIRLLFNDLFLLKIAKKKWFVVTLRK
jgi:hypothetical protein